LDDITPEVMDTVAKRLGAPDHRAFLAIASGSMKCAFRLVCELTVENQRLRAPDRAGGGHNKVPTA
jgi:hypothetical protein